MQDSTTTTEPSAMSDAALLAAWDAVEDYDESSMPERATAILAEIEKRGLDI